MALTDPPGWSELCQAVADSLPDRDADQWLGQLVIETQRASDRAVAKARRHAEAMVAGARAEARAIREGGVRPAPSGTYGGSVLDGLPNEDSLATIAPAPNPPRGTVRIPSPPRVRSITPPTPAMELTPVQDDAAAAPLFEDLGRVGIPRVQRERTSQWWRRTLLLALALFVAGVLAFTGFERYITGLTERRSQQSLESVTRRSFSGGSGGTAARHGVFALIDVPRLGIDDIAVLDGATLDHLRQGPTLVASPGSSGGPIVVLAHRRTYGRPFSRVAELRAGDRIWLQTALGRQGFQVYGTPRSGKLGQTFTVPVTQDAPSLVLETSDDLSGNRAIAVVATPVDDGSVTTRADTAVGTPVPFLGVSGDGSALLGLAVWGVLLVVGIILIGRPARRLPPVVVKTVAYLGGTVVVYELLRSLDRILPGTL